MLITIQPLPLPDKTWARKKYDRIDAIAKICTVLVFVTWILMSGATILFGRPLLGLYTSDSEVIEIGMLRIKVLMIAYFTAGIMNVFPGLTRGMGYSHIAYDVHADRSLSYAYCFWLKTGI